MNSITIVATLGNKIEVFSVPTKGTGKSAKAYALATAKEWMKTKAPSYNSTPDQWQYKVK